MCCDLEEKIITMISGLERTYNEKIGYTLEENETTIKIKFNKSDRIREIVSMLNASKNPYIISISSSLLFRHIQKSWICLVKQTIIKLITEKIFDYKEKHFGDISRKYGITGKFKINSNQIDKIICYDMGSCNDLWRDLEMEFGEYIKIRRGCSYNYMVINLIKGKYQCPMLLPHTFLLYPTNKINSSTTSVDHNNKSNINTGNQGVKIDENLEEILKAKVQSLKEKSSLDQDLSNYAFTLEGQSKSLKDQIHDLEEKNKSLNDRVQNSENDCVICLERSKSMACVPCGHYVLCKECSSEIISNSGICPICRRHIVQFIQIYS